MLLYFASVAYGRTLSGHTHLGILVYIYEDDVSFRDTLKNGVLECISGIRTGKTLQRGRRSWEGNQLLMHSLHLEGKSSSERHDCWAAGRRLDDGKRHAERRYELYYYTMLCIYPPMAEHFFSWTPETVSQDEETYTRYCLVIYLIKWNNLHATKKLSISFGVSHALRYNAT